VKTVPIERFPVAIVSHLSRRFRRKSPPGSASRCADWPSSGYGRVNRSRFRTTVEKRGQTRRSEEVHGAYSFRNLGSAVEAKSPGRYSVAVGATDEKGNAQLDETGLGSCGYLWNASSGRNWWWANCQLKGKTAMKKRAVAIIVAACGLALAAGVLYADLKKCAHYAL